MSGMETMSHESSGICWCGPNNHGPERRSAHAVLDSIKTRLSAVSQGPWESSCGATADGTAYVTSKDDKSEFLTLSLNNNDAPLWLVVSPDVIPAATGDGPRAQANAEFIASAPTDLERLTFALESVLAYGRDREKYTDTGSPAADRAIRSYAYHVQRIITDALQEP